jgi:hypothetical protein
MPQFAEREYDFSKRSYAGTIVMLNAYNRKKLNIFSYKNI